MRLPLIFIFLVLLFASCSKTQSFDKEKATQEILALHKLQREYHFKKDSISFVNQISENFISVSKGVITQPSKKEMSTQYSKYFSSVDFEKWDDITPPIIHFSNDGSLAYSIVDKLVRLKYTSNGEVVTSETHYAWTTLYKKYKEGWKIECVTSTEKPL